MNINVEEACEFFSDNDEGTFFFIFMTGIRLHTRVNTHIYLSHKPSTGMYTCTFIRAVPKILHRIWSSHMRRPKW